MQGESSGLLTERPLAGGLLKESTAPKKPAAAPSSRLRTPSAALHRPGGGCAGAPLSNPLPHMHVCDDDQRAALHVCGVRLLPKAPQEVGPGQLDVVLQSSSTEAALRASLPCALPTEIRKLCIWAQQRLWAMHGWDGWAAAVEGAVFCPNSRTYVALLLGNKACGPSPPWPPHSPGPAASPGRCASRAAGSLPRPWQRVDV